jgi:hypothetical protein
VARFNTTNHRTRPAVATTTSPIATVSKTPDTRTFEGAAGWTRTAKAELFLRAAGAFHGGVGSFYENAEKRDERLRELLRTVAIEDPQWCVEFATWLRGPGNIRTGALMFAVEFVHERLAHMKGAGVIDHCNRQIINAACQRPDEPGEILAIWTAWFGRRIPKPVKRGVADAVRRLYHPKSLLKWDTASKGYRFGDVLNLVHAAPDPDKPWQGDLFQYALDRRHHPDTAVVPKSLPMVAAHRSLMEMSVEERRKFMRVPHIDKVLADAGMTWEALAGWLQGPMDKAAWEAVIPSMPFMAQLRNLRNFDEAGVSDKVAQQVIDRLTDPEDIAKSRQFPFRFHTAYREAPSLRWAHALDKALTASLSNVPFLGGSTLIMVDTSSSMEHRVSEKSSVLRWDAATLFGVALGQRCAKAEVVSFSSTRRWMGDPPGANTKTFQLKKGESLLRSIDRWKADGFFLGGGTDTMLAVKRHFAGHDRVVIITDEQAHDGDPGSVIPKDTPLYTWNLAGYEAAHTSSGSNARFSLGGLTDKAFTLIPILESGAQGTWPWKVDATA